jgi:hypothetical protein
MLAPSSQLKLSRSFAQKNKSRIIRSKYTKKPSAKGFTLKVYPTMEVMPSFGPYRFPKRPIVIILKS